MSIAALADNRLLRTAAAAPSAAQTKAAADRKEEAAKPGALTPIAGVPSDALNAIVRWIPTEGIAAYVAIQAAVLDKLVAKKGQKVCQLDYTSRWVVFAIGLALSVALVPLLTGIKARSSSTPKFQMPWGEMGFTALAFVLWAVALPDTPLNSVCGWKSGYGAALLIVGSVLIPPIASLLNLTPAGTTENTLTPAKQGG